jgi:dTDP-4-amino-4,6-dideoxygalactose transaminase
MQVPLLDLKLQYVTMRDEIRAAIDAVCDSQYFILGGTVADFEAQVAEYCDAPYAVGVTSGSDALIIALMAEGIGPGDEVIAPTFTFFATAGAISRVGAKPVFVDIDPATGNIDPDATAAAVTDRTRAIIPVHLYGQCAEMDPLLELAQQHDLVVIEDACQAIGSEYKGKRAGVMGDYGCFSFFPSKNLGGFGDGGMVVCRTEEQKNKLVALRNHGSQVKYYYDCIGGNFRLDALQAAVLSIKLRHLDDWTAGRQRNAEIYRGLFAESRLSSEQVILPSVVESCTRHVYNQFCIRLPGKRDAVKAHLHANNVGCDIYYPLPLHMQKCFADLGGKAGDAPESEAIASDILAIPIFPELTEEQLSYVVKQIAEAVTA